jgi:hypothetical protein
MMIAPRHRVYQRSLTTQWTECCSPPKLEGSYSMRAASMPLCELARRSEWSFNTTA